VRRGFCACVFLLLLGTIGGQMQQRSDQEAPPSNLLGIWTGTWEGAGTGGFELTLDKGKDGAPGGSVSVTGEPTYKATLKTLSFEGTKMTATYDFPPDEQIEILLTATFEGKTAKGTWAARQKAGGGELASGTWTVARK
jgi:hypothetical protein